jgi:hypothetical protein
MNKRYKRLFSIGIIIIFALLFVYYLNNRSGVLCRRAGQTIKIGFNEESVRCCKGLVAIIETKSNIRCEVLTNENKDLPRVTSLGQ